MQTTNSKQSPFKRFIALFLVLVVLLGMFPESVFAETPDAPTDETGETQSWVVEVPASDEPGEPGLTDAVTETTSAEEETDKLPLWKKRLP